MDYIDVKILDILQTDGRITMKELGQRVGLTSPATIERVKKLEEGGVIVGYRTTVDTAKAGLPIRALILVACGDRGDAFADFARNHPGLIVCRRLAGSYAYLAEAVLADTGALERLLDEIAPFGRTETHLVLSTPVAEKKVSLP